MTKAAIYSRSSKGGNDRQRDELLAKFGETLKVVGEYEDTASGSQGVGDRPALKKLLDDAANGEFDVLFCNDLTRLTRQVPPEIVTALKKAGVRIVTAEGNEVGIADLVLANAARTFVEHQSERIKRGIRAARP